MAPLDVPIYITETGIADRKGDKRPLWLSTYIPQVPEGLVYIIHHRLIYSDLEPLTHLPAHLHLGGVALPCLPLD